MKTLNNNTQNEAATLSSIYIPRMLTIKEVVHLTGLGTTTIYDMLDKKSKRYDDTFPTQIKLTKEYKNHNGNKVRNGRVAWVESEIAEWIESKIAARFH